MGVSGIIDSIASNLCLVSEQNEVMEVGGASNQWQNSNCLLMSPG